MPCDVQLEDVLLRKGTVSLGYFWQNRPYNVYHWIDAQQNTVALYFNIADGTHISEQAIEWRDLTVDVLITPDERCRVLDEDELPDDLDADLQFYIEKTRDELRNKPVERLAEFNNSTRRLLMNY